MNDPSMDIYQVMDAAGLSAGNIKATREPMEKVVGDIRLKVAKGMKELIERRENGTGI